MSYETAFTKAINRILGHEGGYVNDPYDPGGETKWGISKRAFPLLDIKNLSRSDAIDLYYTQYWKPLGLHRMDDGTGYQLMDSAVNSGIFQSIRFLQRAVGVADDGMAGPVTFAALDKFCEAQQIMLFVAERISFMTKLRSWPTHGKGWMNRIAKNLQYGAQDIT